MFRRKFGFFFLFIAINLTFIANKITLSEHAVENEPLNHLSVTGLVTVDGLPVSSDIQINSLLKFDKSFLKVHASKSNGLFTLNLPVGDVYEIVIEVPHFPPQVIELSTVNLDTALSLNAFADFTSPEYDRKLENLLKSNAQKFNSDAAFFKETFEQNHGDDKKDNLSYKVQIGAFKFFENFNYNCILGMPKIIRQTDTDFITRFTMGSYSTYNEAKELLDKLHKNKLPDAFIIAVFNSERKSLHQLVEEKILE